jgi:hypothetical protein
VTVWWRSFSRYEKTLLFLFLISLPFVHPAVEGDGVGYYAYLRSPLIDHNFQFAGDYKDPKNELLSIYLDRHFIQNPITKTGHLPNFYSVGPAILWLPFIAVTHAVVLALKHFGWSIAADGHSRPYIVILCVATALYGFLGLWISFRLARKYVDERWAFWATLAIWLASSLPLFLYLYPSWSHAHSVFCVSLFLWYWDRTRGTRTPRQWLVLGLLSGLMLDVYSANVVFVLAPAIEAASAYFRVWRKRAAGLHEFWSNVRSHLSYAAGAFLALLPTFIAREIVYGNPLAAGVYAGVPWRWAHPMFRAVLFDTSHGLFICTPILLLAVVGIFLLVWRRPEVGRPCLAISLAFYVLISLYPWWFGAFGFGNRFFVSLTPIFILGLSFLFSESLKLWGTTRAASRRLLPVTALFILWNLGLVYQWSVDMFPWRSQVYWDEVLYDQFRVVPQQAFRDLRAKFSPHAEPRDASMH